MNETNGIKNIGKEQLRDLEKTLEVHEEIIQMTQQQFHDDHIELMTALERAKDDNSFGVWVVILYRIKLMNIRANRIVEKLDGLEVVKEVKRLAEVCDGC